MASSEITILKNTILDPDANCSSNVITFEELAGWVKNRKIVSNIFRYRESQLLTYELDLLSKPLVTALLLRMLSRGHSFIEDELGNRQDITVSVLVKYLYRMLRDSRRKSSLLALVQQELSLLEANDQTLKSQRNLGLSGTPVYVRSDLLFGVRSGGSVGHIAGVLNNLDSFLEKPIFLTSDMIPTVRHDIETYRIKPEVSLWDFKELPTFNYNRVLNREAKTLLSNKKLSFIYQRYGLNNYSGAELSNYYGLPFVLEYNGSEIWVNRNWGQPLKYETLSERIELLNLKAADVVVVVSQAIKDELVARGIEPEKVLVNPNGVDPDKYSPQVDGSAIRTNYALDDKTVIGFIGTFGKWHGAEVLAEAFGKLLQTYPEYRVKVHLLMIGDGVTMMQVRENLSKYGVKGICTLTGIIPQEEGPSYLAACDILASPHVPNPDGSPFFGSPTKLFEYMAMGKGIVASDLDQIGEILEHNKTAWMVKPGDVDSLVGGLKILIDDKDLRAHLGKAAREEVVAKYTWKEHTRKIIEKLKERCG
ncbi:MAG TPA: glycosyltransferase family 4 protein [Candidatus Aquicultor sp.]